MFVGGKLTLVGTHVFQKISDKRFVLSLVVLVTIAVNFWLGSRYPALDEKAVMGGDLQLEDSLSFELTLEHLSSHTVVNEIWVTFVNWIFTNQQGMTFGILFAAAFLTLLSLLNTRSFKSGLANSFLGIFIGTPMGVCVNCVAPIARGMHAGGTRLETTLSTMVSSPTLNIVVLTMLFSLLPFYMAMTKIVLTIVFIVVAIPLLVRFVNHSESAGNDELICDVSLAKGSLVQDNAFSWIGTIRWYVLSYTKNLWFILKKALPLMLLAGLLGACVVSVLPWDEVVSAVGGLSLWQKIIALCGLAAFGLFLPVPIAFDVVICASLLGVGMDPAYVMVLLFTLGIFSIYSYSILGSMTSWYLASSMAAILICFGILSGVAVHFLEMQDTKQKETFYYQELSEKIRGGFDAVPPPSQISVAGVGMREQLPLSPIEYQPLTLEQSSELKVEYAPHALDVTSTKNSFVVLEDGIRESEEITLRMPHKLAIVPYYMNAGVSVGDVHGDGWEDLLIGSNGQMTLYINVNGRFFSPQSIDIPALDGGEVFVSSLVDLNNDGQLDLFFSIFRGGNYVIYNQEGRYLSKNMVKLPKGSAHVATSAAFADLDRDGMLEIVLGNYYDGKTRGYSYSERRNQLLRWSGSEYLSEALPGIPGVTWTTLLTDLNQDGHTDLVVGNDFGIPDQMYFGDAEDEWNVNAYGDKGVFSISGDTTMSAESVDINNDLILELYMGQISGQFVTERRRLNLIPLDEQCDEVTSTTWSAQCGYYRQVTIAFNKDSPEACTEVDSPLHRMDCIATALYRWTKFGSVPALFERCNLIPDEWEDLKFICTSRFDVSSAEPIVAVEGGGSDLSTTVVKGRNFMFVKDGEGYSEVSKDLGIDAAGWTWNAKFADFNNDEWQDLYITNGSTVRRELESNMFFVNKEGKHFEEQTKVSGLQNHLPFGGWVSFDMDNDGDLDVVSVPFIDAPVLYRNELTTGNSITIELRDLRGNRYAVGSRIIIRYGEDSSLHQMREVKLGGGYRSFDAGAIHFGLGEYSNVSEVEIHWPNGEVSIIDDALSVGNRYRITRVDE